MIHVEFVKLNVMQKSKSLMKMLLLLNIHFISSSEIDEIKSGKRVLLSSGSLLTSNNSNNNAKPTKIELIFSHGKFIKFKSCQNCTCKLNVDCCFKMVILKKIFYLIKIEKFSIQC